MFGPGISAVGSYSPNIESIVLGRGHLIPRSELLAAITPAVNLTNLHLFYDNFISRNSPLINGPLSEFPGFPALDELIVRHQGVGTRPDYSDLFSWIHLIASNSVMLRSLSIISDDSKRIRCPPYLLAFLSTLPLLKLLNIPYITLEAADLYSILTGRTQLEVLAFWVISGPTGLAVCITPLTWVVD
jgi:hypothetical protein